MYLNKLGIFFSVAILSAQDRPLSFGLTGGVPLTGGLRANADTSKRYTFGLLGEYRFTQHISLLVNPLYRRTGSDFRAGTLFPINELTQSVDLRIWDRAHNLDVPILGRYTFLDPNRKWRPFVSLGFSVNTSWRERKTVQTTQNTQSGAVTESIGVSNSRTSVYTSAVTGAGIDYKLPKLHILPEFRYSFHGRSNPANREGNQVDFLLSLRF
jgi:outer membrane protein W